MFQKPASDSWLFCFCDVGELRGCVGEVGVGFLGLLKVGRINPFPRAELVATTFNRGRVTGLGRINRFPRAELVATILNRGSFISLGSITTIPSDPSKRLFLKQVCSSPSYQTSKCELFIARISFAKQSFM
jgi:hypothetical protein